MCPGESRGEIGEGVGNEPVDLDEAVVSLLGLMTASLLPEVGVP